MNKHSRWLLCLALAALATSCTFYRVKDVDGKALAAKGTKGKIVSVQTAEGTFAFDKNDPAAVQGEAIVGTVYEALTYDPADIADVAPGKNGPSVVLKDGTRFRAASLLADGESLECLAARTVCIPLDEVVRAKVRTVDTVGSIMGTLAGVVLVAGAVALDAASTDADEEIDYEDSLTLGIISGLFEDTGDAPGGSGRRKAGKALLGSKDASDPAGETEFWTVEWMPVDLKPDGEGKLLVRVENASGLPRGIDEARLFVVDRAPGVAVAPDILGGLRALAGPVAPDAASDGERNDIRELVSALDGVFWRASGDEAAADRAASGRNEITFSFPRPKGARSARLIVNAANSAWPALFAREVAARPAPATGDKNKTTPPAYQNWEYGKVRVRMLTVLGWQTVQAIFAPGPLPAADLIYDLDLGDVGTDKVWLKLSFPSGFWLFDRLAVDFGEGAPLEIVEVAAADVDGPDAAEVVAALDVEDGTTLRLDTGGPSAVLTFVVPPPKEGLERSLFLRTVSCYEMPLLGPGPIRPPGSRR